MQVTPHVYAAHIPENPKDGGAFHPGGTHIYFVGDSSDHMVMVDSGEPYRSWTNRILDYYEELGRPRMSTILVTHGHGDHVGGLDRLQEEFGCEVKCHPKLVRRLQRMLGDGVVSKLASRERVPVGGGLSMTALFTPGHEDDHVCYYLSRERVLFTGDTILGSSSSTVRNLSEYMRSLHLLARFTPKVICPGHGSVVHNGSRRIDSYIRHREEREAQVINALEAGAGTVEEIVTQVYPRNLRRELKQAAGRNVSTHLGKLVDEGRVKSYLDYSLVEP